MPNKNERNTSPKGLEETGSCRVLWASSLVPGVRTKREPDRLLRPSLPGCKGLSKPLHRNLKS